MTATLTTDPTEWTEDGADLGLVTSYGLTFLAIFRQTPQSDHLRGNKINGLPMILRIQVKLGYCDTDLMVQTEFSDAHESFLWLSEEPKK